MNPLTNVRNITKLSERELKQNDGKTSWHDEYRDSAWVFIGGLPYELTEGDVIAVFSQYGEPVNLNLVRDKVTGKSKGFGFLCYEDQRSTVLAVDNFNGTKISGRTIRVDHVKDYKPPKDSDKLDDITRNLHLTGCGYGVELPGLPSTTSATESPSVSRRIKEEVIHNKDFLLPLIKSERLSVPPDSRQYRQDRKRPSSKDTKHSKEKDSKDRHKSKKSKKDKKKKSKKSKKRRRKSSSSSSASDSDSD